MLDNSVNAEKIAIEGLDWIRKRFDEFLPISGLNNWHNSERQSVSIAECTITSLIASRLGSPRVATTARHLLKLVFDHACPELLDSFNRDPALWARPLLVTTGALTLAGCPHEQATYAVQQAFLHGELSPDSLRLDQIQEMQFWLHACAILQTQFLTDWQTVSLEPHALAIINSSSKIETEIAYILTHGIFYMTGFNLSLDQRYHNSGSILEAVDRCISGAEIDGNIDILSELIFAKWCIGHYSDSEAFFKLLNKLQLPDGSIAPCLNRHNKTDGYCTEDFYHSTLASILGCLAIAGDC